MKRETENVKDLQERVEGLINQINNRDNKKAALRLLKSLGYWEIKYQLSDNPGIKQLAYIIQDLQEKLERFILGE